MLAEVKNGYPAWFGLLHPHTFLDTKEVLVVLGGEDSTKVPGANPLYWELVCNEFIDAFKNPGTPPKRAIKHKIDLLPDSIPPAKK